MDIAYRFRALNTRNRPIAGTIYAKGKDLAYSKLKRNGFRPRVLTFAPLATLRNAIAPDFDSKDLARFYRTLGRRLNNGRTLADGLESAAEFIRDDKLRQASQVMRQCLNDGRREHEAMMAADFPQRDTMIIRAAAESGKIGDAFLAIAHEVERKAKLRDAVTKVFRMPAIIGVIMWVFIYAAIHWITPKTLVFMKNINANVSPMHAKFFAFSESFNANLLVGTILYLLVPVLIVQVLRSRWFGALLDRVRVINELSVKADMGSLWTGYTLLYEATIPPADGARMIKAAAARRDSAECFAKLEKILATGVYLEVGVEKAGFPKFVIDGVKAAVMGGDTVDGLRDMTHDLEEDVAMSSEILRENATVASMFVMGLSVAMFFYMSYYPVMSAALKNI